MIDRATSRDAKRRQTAARITDVARRRTAEDGLAGFTLDELADETGISRRTFFNYFASKEDAVIGVPGERDRGDIVALEEAFAAEVDETPLVDAYARLVIARWEQLALTREAARAMFAAVEREPRLHHRMFELMREHVDRDIDLVERRGGLERGDLRASTLVHVLGTFNRLSAEALLSGDSPPTPTAFASMTTARLAAARSLFT